MKRILIPMLLAAALTSQAQTSRRAVEATATDAVRQMTLTGHAPSDSILGRLATTATISIEMINKMPDPAAPRQSRECLKLIDAIAAYAKKSADEPVKLTVREGLKKAIDRSFDAENRQRLMAALLTISQSSDAEYIAQYLSDPDMAFTASEALVAMPGIDACIDSLMNLTTPPDPQLLTISKARAGKIVLKARSTVRKQAAPPAWTTYLDQAVDRLRAISDPEADKLLLAEDKKAALTSLLALAAKREGEARDAVLARYVVLAEQTDLASGERYLALRAADELNPSDDLRRKIIVALGTTRTVQALAYIRQYYDSRTMADAAGVAVWDIVCHNPDANGGRYVRNMLTASKQAYVRHYEEQGSGDAIDDLFATIDECAEQGYSFSTTVTNMGKRGFWNMYDELKDFALAFDWKTDGTLVVNLRSMPILTLDSTMGARLAGGKEWKKFGDAAPWRTCIVHVEGDKVSVCVNGHDVFTNERLANPEGKTVNASGTISFHADEGGASVRQVCIKK